MRLFGYILILGLIMGINPVMAKEREHTVQGYAMDSFTGQNLPGVSMVLMTADSVVIDTTTTLNYPDFPDFTGMYQFSIKRVGKYIIKATCIGYETAYMNFSLRSNRENAIILKPIRMVSKTQELPEVVVKATKIKMIYSGDTIIYNADAFKLVEGSMLDGLIRKLPGACIDNNGQITVNGRYVESLLVNGREFFQGNPKVALENLPAYTVDKVKVYNKQGAASQLMNRDMDDYSYVMDVRLKKEYAVGYLGNIIAGAGIHSRYNLQSLCTRFSEKENLSAFLNVNNLNDSRRSGFDKAWKAAMQSGGLTSRKSVGINYTHNFSKDSYIQSSNSYSHTDTDKQTETNSQTFLGASDAFAHAFNVSQKKQKHWQTNNSLWIQKADFYSISRLAVDYAKGQNWGSQQTETAEGLVLLNSLLNQSQGDTRDFSFQMSMENGIRLVADMLLVNANLNYSNRKQTDFSLYDLRYTNGVTPRDYRRTYMTTPVQNLNSGIKIGYAYCWGWQTIRPSYHYDYQYSKDRRQMLRLEQMAVNDSIRIDILPSTVRELKSMLDLPNSYVYRKSVHSHTLGLEYTNNFSQEGLNGMLKIELPLKWNSQRLDGFRVNEQQVSRHTIFFEPLFFIRIMPLGYWACLTVHHSSEMPELIYLSDFRDDSDLLRVKLGNGELKNIHHLDVKIEFKREWQNQRVFYSNFNYRTTKHAVAYGLVFDKRTGITTTRPESVDGNWFVNGDLGFTSPIGKKKLFTFDNKIRPEFLHSVDLAHVADDNSNRSSVVKTLALVDELKLDYRQNDKASADFHARVRWNHITSNMTDFASISAVDFSLGVSATIDLPWKMQMTTDLDHYFHRGYHTSAMNTNELVWNTSLTKSLLKGKLLFSLYAYDILGQISNHTYRFDAQGRTEIWTNTIPRYAMLSISWRFNKNPKKRR